MAPACFLVAGGLDIPCRLLLRARNLPLQLKMGCGVHPLVQNRRSYMHTHSWAEIGGVQLSLAAGVHIVFACSNIVCVKDMFKCSHSRHSWTPSQVRTGVL